MSNFETSMDAALLNGAIGKRAGLIQGRNEGAALGYQAGWDDGVAEATRAAEAQCDAMQTQLAALQVELANVRAAYQRVHTKWTADNEFLAGLIVVASAAQEALAMATPSQCMEFLTQYANGSKLFKREGHITCEPALSPRFRQDMPSTVRFVNRMLGLAKNPTPDTSSNPSL